jgi:hypothetical protein
VKFRALAALAPLAAASALGIAALPAGATTVPAPIVGGSWLGCITSNQTSWQATIGGALPMVTDGGGVASVQQGASTLVGVAGCWKNTYLAAHPNTPIVYDLPLPSPNAPLSAADRAAYVYAASSLVSLGQQNTIFRLGWEFNGTWMPWSASSNPAQWVANWQAIVTAIRTVPGGNFRFDWNLSNGYSTFDARKAWPGSAYVDVVSDDIYDEDWTNCPQWGPGPGYPLPANDSAADVAARQQYVAHSLIYGNGSTYVAGQAAAPVSGEGWRQFAATQGVSFAVDEWGLDRNTGSDPGASCGGANNDNGGNDDPYFIDAMMSWFHSSYQGTGVEYANYFNTCDVAACNAGIDARINAGLSPLSLARFKADLGTVPTSGPTSTTTTTPSPTVTPSPTASPVPAPVVASAAAVTVARADGTDWAYSGGSAGSWSRVDTDGTTRAVAGSAPVYALHTDGTIWQAGTSGWTKVDTDAASKGIAADSSYLFKLHADGTVLMKTPVGFVPIDNNPTAVAIAATETTIYELHADGQLWGFDGTGWRLADAGAPVVAITAAGSSVYERLSNGTVRVLNNGAWSVLDTSAAISSIVASGASLYEFRTDGSARVYANGSWTAIAPLPAIATPAMAPIYTAPPSTPVATPVQTQAQAPVASTAVVPAAVVAPVTLAPVTLAPVVPAVQATPTGTVMAAARPTTTKATTKKAAPQKVVAKKPVVKKAAAKKPAVKKVAKKIAARKAR